MKAQWHKIIGGMAILFLLAACVSFSLADGSPWIDHDLKENTSSSDTPSAKDDFYHYANRSFILNTSVKNESGTVSSIDTISESMNKNIIAMIKTPHTDHNSELASRMYTEFFDWERRNRVGLSPLIPRINAIIEISSLADLTAFLCDRTNLLSLDYLFNANVEVSLSNAPAYAVWIFPTDTKLLDTSAKIHKNRSRAKNSLSYKNSCLTLERLGFTKYESRLLFKAAFKLEQAVDSHCTTFETGTTPRTFYTAVNNIRNRTELENESPAFPLVPILDALGFGAATEFILTDPAWLSFINEFYVEDNLELFKAYLLVHYSIKSLAFLDRTSYVLANGLDSSALENYDSDTDEKFLCETFSAFMKDVVEPLYVRVYNLAPVKQEVLELCARFVSHYEEMLLNEPWLSEETKRNAVEKLKQLKIMAVYPNKWEDYSDFSFGADDTLFDLVNRLKAIMHEHSVKKVNGYFDSDYWTFSTLESNAFYSNITNSIYILAGFLGGTIYYSGMPVEAMYAGLGETIAHEISHAFDSNGALFDGTGAFKNWWSKKDFAVFTERTKRVSDYYDSIRVFNGKQCNGALVQAEAIADMGAMRCVLQEAAKVPDFDYDAFFTHYAFNGCYINELSVEEEWLESDGHPLPFLRVNVCLQQFDEFLNCYDVCPGDGMYLAPEHRILVW